MAVFVAPPPPDGGEWHLKKVRKSKEKVPGTHLVSPGDSNFEAPRASAPGLSPPLRRELKTHSGPQGKVTPILGCRVFRDGESTKTCNFAKMAIFSSARINFAWEGEGTCTGAWIASWCALLLTPDFAMTFRGDKYRNMEAGQHKHPGNLGTLSVIGVLVAAPSA